MASPALTTLREQRLPEARALLGLRPARLPSQHSTFAAADAVNRACVVVLSAHLEGFIEDLIDDVIDVVNASGPATADLPLQLLAAHVSVEVEAIAAITDVARRAVRIKDLFVDNSALWLDDRLSPGSLSGQSITANLSNPGAKEIARVLGFLGLADVFVNVQLPDGADPEKRVNELVGVRNSIAHGGWPNVGDAQVADYVASIEALGEGLEQEAARHVQSLCRLRALPWP